MDTKLKQVILGLGAAGFALGVSGSALGESIPPQEFPLSGGDVTCQDAINAINASPGNQFPASPRPNITDGFVELLITNPENNAYSTHAIDDMSEDDYDAISALGAVLGVSLDPQAKNQWKLADLSTVPTGETDESQILDIPGFEIAIFQRNNAATAYYQINQNDPSWVYISPGSASQSPNKIRICWAVGPSGMPDALAITQTCNALNAVYDNTPNICDGDPLSENCVRTADGFQAKIEPEFGTTIPFNVTACAPRVARWCDQSLPAGTAENPIENSCNPTGTSFGGTTSSVDAAGGSIVSSFEGMFTNF